MPLADVVFEIGELDAAGDRSRRSFAVADSQGVALEGLGVAARQQVERRLLPLLLVLRTTGVAVTDALNTPDIAEPVIATLVGAMALLVSVPLTTALAAALVHRVPASAMPAGGHSHHH